MAMQHDCTIWNVEDNARRKIPKYDCYTQEWADSIQLLGQLVVPCALPEKWAPNSQYGEVMHT
ncbi:MAG: hypothetical protein IJ708_14240, partial [Clostridia bacterium]|nr:hypothetical protein [Clostridia bacterium]MBR2288302.1 hypothetical protein [Clostridia bacterium]